MKKIITTIAVFTSLGLYAQNNVGIGTLTPNANAKLEIKSDDKGVLITRLTTVARNTLGTALTATEDGMLVYDKDLTAFYYWDGPGLAWVQVGSGAGDNWGTQTVQTAGTNISGDGTTADPLIVTDGDTDATNEIELPATATTGQVLSWDGTDWVAQNASSGADNWGSDVVNTTGTNISGDGTVGSPLTVTDGDSDATNEIEIPIGGTNGQILSTDGSGVYTWINDDAGTDDQNIANLAFDNTTNILTIGIENGTSQTIDLTNLVNDADSDITNEIQDLSITNNILTITNNGTATNIDLSSYLDNTDNQDLSLAGNTLSLTNDGTTVDLSGYLDNTDTQNISGSGLAGTTLTIGIQNGTNETVDLSTLVDHDWYKVGTTSAPTNINDNIFTQGKVGIQEAVPTNMLSIGANLGTGYGLTVNSGTQYGQVIQTTESPTTNNPAFWVRNDEGGNISHLFRVQNNGNVGIGLVNPLVTLHVANGGEFTLEDVNGGESSLRMKTGAGTWLLHTDNGANKFGIQNSTLNTDAITILTNNNVGIGTTGPSTKLHVEQGSLLMNGNVSQIMLKADGGSIDPGDIIFVNGDGTNKARVWSDPVNNEGLQLNGSGNGIVHMSIIQNGNVGIGTTTPTDKLEVSGYVQSKSNAGAVKLAEVDNPNIWWMVADGNYFSIRKNNIGPYPLNIGDNENVGIGTNGIPTEKLEVQGSVKIVDGTQGAGKVLTSDANGKASWQNSGSSFVQSISTGRINITSTNTGNYIYTTNNITIPSAGTYLIFTTAHLKNLSSVESWFNVNYSTSPTTFTSVASSPNSCADMIKANGNRNFTNMNVMTFSGATIIYQYVLSHSSTNWLSYGNGNDGESTIIAIKLN